MLLSLCLLLLLPPFPHKHLTNDLASGVQSRTGRAPHGTASIDKHGSTNINRNQHSNLSRGSSGASAAVASRAEAALSNDATMDSGAQPNPAAHKTAAPESVLQFWSLIDGKSGDLEGLAATHGHGEDQYLGPFLLRMTDSLVCWPRNFTLGLSATYWEVHKRFKHWSGCPERPISPSAPPPAPDPFKGLEYYVPYISPGQSIADAMKALVKDRGELLEAFVQRSGQPECIRQVLGRLMRQVVEWVPDVVDVEPGPDVVIAFSLGTGTHVGPRPISFMPGRIWPGHSNEGLAHTILNLVQANPELNVYVQWEIGDTLTGFSYNVGSSYAITADALAVPSAADPSRTVTYAQITRRNASAAIHKVYPKPGSYLSTAGVAGGLGRYIAALPSPVRRVYVVGHPDHKKRCRVEVQRALAYRKKELPPMDLVFPSIEYYPRWEDHGCDAWAYDHNSTQYWTRSRGRFIPTEMRHKLGWASYKDIKCTGSG